MSFFNQLIEAQRRFQLELLAKANVVGVGIGYKTDNGVQTDQLAIVALVDQKKPEIALHESDRIPPELQGIKTDVVEVGTVRAQNFGPRDRWRPVVPPGVSIGHYRVSAGTLGAVVRDRLTGQYLLLSNNHVLANCNDAQTGDVILQPGATDHGINPSDVVARLERFTPLRFIGDPIVETPPPTPQPPAPTPDPLPHDPVTPPPVVTPPPPVPNPPLTGPSQPSTGTGCSLAGLLIALGTALANANRPPETAQAQNVIVPPSPVYATSVQAQQAIPENHVDCAVARPLNISSFSDEVRYIGRITGTRPPSLGMRVRKVGRTTDYTEGTITTVNTTIDVGYNTPFGPKNARFVGQVMTTGMSQGGDSGSLVVAFDAPLAVGLLFAGSGVVSLFTPIDRVLDSLSVMF
ncbi:hypothetical protein VZO05_01815 [Aggregatilineales bacterium SYSU G02658]